jgi:glycosyltransferase involved in cell wall biosynthesis
MIAVTDSMALLLLRGQLRAAREFGFDVVVVSSPGETAARIAGAEGVRHIAVPMNRAIAPIEDLRSLGRLVAEMRAYGPHIVNASTPKAGLLATVAGWLTGVPCRVHTLRGLRLDTTRGVQRGVLAAMTWLTCALAHRVICISPSLRRRAEDLGLVAAGKAVVLGAGSSNGIDLGPFTATDRDRAAAAALRRRLGIDGGVPVMGFVGRIARDKGMVELAEAWRVLRRAHPDLHWLIVGPPDATDAIPGAILAGLERDERVHLLGRTDDVVPAYLAMDVLVLPTHREGFGNVLVEAAALEIPTVASAVTGCVDAVVDGVTGTLIRPGDPEELARAVDAYLRDPALRQAHGRAGRVRAEELFDQERLWARMHREYLELARAAGLDVSPLGPGAPVEP